MKVRQHSNMGFRRSLCRGAMALRPFRFAPFSAAILMYHRFRPDDMPGYVLTRSEFADQIELVLRHFDVLPLHEVLARPRGRRPALALTVDDGYASFAEVAFPVLRAHGLPATVFLPLHFIEQGEWLWQDRNIFLLREARPQCSRFSWGQHSLTVDTRTRPGLRRTLERIYHLAARLPLPERAELSAALSVHLETDLPARPRGEFAPMTWSQVLDLQGRGITFGAHTMTHQILTLCDVVLLPREIADARVRLAERLGCEVDFFAYPNGDFNDEVRRQVRAAGYRYALSTRPGFWYPGDDPLAIRRVPAPSGDGGAMSEQLLRYLVRFR